MNWKRVVSLLLVLMMVGSVVNPALAAEQKPSRCPTFSKRVVTLSNEKAIFAVEEMMSNRKNAEKIFKNLPPDIRNEVIDLLKVKIVTVRVKKSESISTLSTGYKSVSVTVEGKDAIGITLWKYTQQIDWSYDGSKIKSVFRTRYGTVYMPFWKFNGHIGNQEMGGVGQWLYRAWTQGEFSLCLGGDIGCIQHVYPWIDMSVYGNGDWHGEKGY